MGQIRVRPSNHKLNGVHKIATRQIWLNDLCLAEMWNVITIIMYGNLWMVGKLYYPTSMHHTWAQWWVWLIMKCNIYVNVLFTSLYVTRQQQQQLPSSWTRLACFISFIIAASSRKSFKSIVSSCSQHEKKSISVYHAKKVLRNK